MKQRNAAKWWVGLLFGLTLILTAAMPVQAAKQKVVEKKLSAKQIKTVSGSKGKYEFLSRAVTANAVAIAKGSPRADRWSEDQIRTLSITQNGTSEKVIDLDQIVRKKLKLSKDTEIAFYQLTAIKNVFYVTGAYADSSGGMGMFEGGTAFYVSTKNGNSVTVKKLPESSMHAWRCVIDRKDGWGLYYLKGQYVAVADCVTVEDFEKMEYTYYSSKNLKKWTTRKLSASKTTEKLHKEMGGEIHFHFSHVTGQALYFVEEINGGPNGDYQGIPTITLIYTTDLKNYAEASSFNKTIRTNGKWKEYGKSFLYTKYVGYGDGENSVVLTYEGEQQTTDESFSIKSFKMYTASGLKQFKNVINRSGAWNSCFTLTNTGMARPVVFLDAGSKHEFYILSPAAGSAEKYTTSLAATNINSGDADPKQKWIFFLYEGKYLLATKDNGKTMYRMKTGKNNLSGVATVGEKVLLLSDGGPDYYIPIAAIEKTLK